MRALRISAKEILVSAGVLALLLSLDARSHACDTWVAMRDQTTCGRTILGKNSDRPQFDCQPLVFHPRQRWPEGVKIDLARVSIPQTRESYATLGSSPYWSWGYEEGINEHGVAIGNEAIGTKVLVEELASHESGKGPKLGPTGMDLVRLGLERGKTARESFRAIAAVVEEHGQFGSASPTRGVSGAYHNSFIIADQKEAYVLETAGTHWVAKRIEKGATSISNGVSLGTDFDLASADVVRHAVDRGWWPAEKTDEFHFQHAYMKGVEPDSPVAMSIHGRAACSRRLLAEKAGRIDVRWMMHIARSPSINMNATASSCVAVLPESEEELPVFWWCAAVPSCSCYIPFFIHGTGPPEIISTAGTYGSRIERPSKVAADEFSDDSFWWLFRDLSDQVMADRKEREPTVRKAFDALEKEFEAGAADVIKRAARLRNEGKTEQAASILDAYTTHCLKNVLVKVNELRAGFTSPRA